MKTELLLNTTLVLLGAEFSKSLIVAATDFAQEVEKFADSADAPIPGLKDSPDQMMGANQGIAEPKNHSKVFEKASPLLFAATTAISNETAKPVAKRQVIEGGNGSQTLQTSIPKVPDTPILQQSSAKPPVEQAPVSGPKHHVYRVSDSFSKTPYLKSETEHPSSDTKISVQSQHAESDPPDNADASVAKPATRWTPPRAPSTSDMDVLSEPLVQKRGPNQTTPTATVENLLSPRPTMEPSLAANGPEFIAPTNRKPDITNHLRHPTNHTAQSSNAPPGSSNVQPEQAPASVTPASGHSPIDVKRGHGPSDTSEMQTRDIAATPFVESQKKPISGGEIHRTHLGSGEIETKANFAPHNTYPQSDKQDQPGHNTKTTTHPVLRNTSTSMHSLMPEPTEIDPLRAKKITSTPTMAEFAFAELPPTSPPPATNVTPQSPTTSVDFTRHIIRSIAEAATGLQDRPIELTLSPEELGRVRMTLHNNDGNMSVTVSVERPETLELLRRNIEMLASQLREIGYKDISFEFTSQGNNFTGNDAAHPGDTPDSDPPPETDQPLEPIHISLTEPGRVDIRL